MDLFEEISKIKKELPKGDSITSEIRSRKFNFYQCISIALFVISFFLGIFLGNLLSTCQVSSFFYFDTCLVSEFNFFVMIIVWFIGGLLSIFLYAIGQGITILTSIDEKLAKNK